MPTSALHARATPLSPIDSTATVHPPDGGGSRPAANDSAPFGRLAAKMATLLQLTDRAFRGMTELSEVARCRLLGLQRDAVEALADEMGVPFAEVQAVQAAMHGATTVVVPHKNWRSTAYGPAPEATFRAAEASRGCYPLPPRLPESRFAPV